MLTLQLAGNFHKLLVGQGDLPENCGDGVAGDSFEIVQQRHHKYSAQINRRRTHRQLARVKDFRPMLPAREQIRDPFPSVMKDCDVDHRLRSFAGRLREQIDGTIHSIDKSRSLSSTKQEHLSPVIRNCDAIQSCRVLLDRKQSSRTSLKVHMVWRGRAAFRTIIDDEISRESCSKVEHISELIRDALQAVFPVSNRQVTINDWKRIAVDREVVIERQTLFLRRQISSAEEARALRNRLAVDRGCRTTHTMGDGTDEDVEPV